MIGIYAHHHGSGHLHRCRAIQRELRAMGREAQILSTTGGDVALLDDASAGPRELRSGLSLIHI